MINLEIRKNKWLLCASIIMMIYSILEVVDSIVIFLIVLNVIPNLSFVLKFYDPTIQLLLETQPLILAPIFWGFTLMRVFSTIGLFRNLLWGFWIGSISLILTMIFSVLFLPFGAFEFLTCCIILILLLIGYFSITPIINTKVGELDKGENSI